LITPAAGFWFDKPQVDSFEGSTPVFVVRPRVIILAPSEAVASKFSLALSGHCAVCSTLINDGDDKSTASRLRHMLEAFQSDVAIVAPACASVVDEITETPASWMESTADIGINDIILIAKPVEAMAKIHKSSWLATRRSDWKLDGAPNIPST
jgi:hypothetical protein